MEQPQSTVPIVEAFKSVQGEGPTIGLVAHFLRVRGCNLKCLECDTRYSWAMVPFGGKTWEDWTKEQVIEWMREKDVIVLTGGEPMMYPALLDCLGHLPYISRRLIVIETNGTIKPPAKTRQVLGKLLYQGSSRSGVHMVVSPKFRWFHGSEDCWNPIAIKTLAGYSSHLTLKVVVRGIVDAREVLARMEFDQLWKVTDELVFQPVMYQDQTRRITPGDYLSCLSVLTSAILKRDLPAGRIRILPQLHWLLWRGQRGR